MNFNISDVSTTKMTSKGQVVIPEEIREYMGLESGVKFLVMASDDSIIFKKITPIPKQDIKALLESSHRFAKEHGITEKDLEQAIADIRKERKLNSTGKPPIARTKSMVKKHKLNLFTEEPVEIKAKPSLRSKTKPHKIKIAHSKGKDKSSN